MTPLCTCASRGEGGGVGSACGAGCVEGSEPEAMRQPLSASHPHLQNGWQQTPHRGGFVVEKEKRDHVLATSETVKEADVGEDCAKLTVAITVLIIMHFLSFL